MEFEIICFDCGSELAGTWSMLKGELRLEVEPCDTCKRDSYDEGREEGGKAND